MRYTYTVLGGASRKDALKMKDSAAIHLLSFALPLLSPEMQNEWLR